MILDLTKFREIAHLAKELNIKSLKYMGCDIEFFPKASEPMPLDPVALSKILTDSMPPDSAMMFAATEDPVPDPILNPSEEKVD